MKEQNAKKVGKQTPAPERYPEPEKTRKLYRHSPQTATNHTSTTFMFKKELIGRPIPEKRNEKKKGDRPQTPTPEPEGARKSRWNTILFLRKERKIGSFISLRSQPGIFLKRVMLWESPYRMF